MGHELRTPMNAILGLTGLSLKSDLSPQLREYLTTVDQSTRGLMDIIDGILDFSDLQSGELVLDDKPFSVDQLMQQQAGVFTSIASAKGLSLIYDVASDVPDWVCGDASRLGQVLAVLTSNAVKFSEQGEVRVSVNPVVDMRNTDDRELSLRFSVADGGPGIDSDKKAQLFETFSQSDNSHTRQHGGAGLGLSIAAKLVELMGSVIDVDSTPGHGSTFSFQVRLPVVDGVADEEGGSHLAGAASGDMTAIQGARVLLVDDSDINLQVAGEILRQARLIVDTAENGQIALEQAQKSDYDCVLMDIQMPVMDGYEATQRIREIDRLTGLPIVAMTANTRAEDKEKALAVGMNAHIGKPVDPDELYRELLCWIEPGDREVPQSQAPSTEETDELPDTLPGLSISDGLARVGGNTKLYLGLLSDVARDYGGAGDAIANLVCAGDTDGAAQMAHKLRGIANNLGAHQTGAAAGVIEACLRAGASSLDAELTELCGALDELCSTIAGLQAASSADGDSTRLNSEEIQTLLSQLAQEIADNNPGAGDTALELLQGVAAESAIAEPLQAICEALDIFDFASAAELRNTLSDQIE